jgi:hypothetical protein
MGNGEEGIMIGPHAETVLILIDLIYCMAWSHGVFNMILHRSRGQPNSAVMHVKAL